MLEGNEWRLRSRWLGDQPVFRRDRHGPGGSMAGHDPFESVELRSRAPRARWFADRSAVSAGSTRVGGAPERPRPLESVDRRPSPRFFAGRSEFSLGSTGSQVAARTSRTSKSGRAGDFLPEDPRFRRARAAVRRGRDLESCRTATPLAISHRSIPVFARIDRQSGRGLDLKSGRTTTQLAMFAGGSCFSSD